MVKVKICGITNLEDAKTAIAAGCDALGFAFYKKSPRYVSPEKARQIIARLPMSVTTIGVFVNASEKRVKAIARACRLDMIQFHGEESPAFCRKFARYKVIKAFRVKDTLDIARIRRYNTFAYLFDSFVKEKPGGTGKTFHWQLIKHLQDLKQPVFLSGGLTQENVAKAIQSAHPAWVDVSSGVELVPGKKDAAKVQGFIKAAKTT